MHDCRPGAYLEKGLYRPFWIVNLHVAFNDDRGGARSRNGDAFEVTPLRAGSDTTRYLQVPPPPLPRNHRWMHPRVAVSISGAAIDSQGAPRSLLLNWGTQALNFDLGTFVESWGDNWIVGPDTGPGEIFCRNGAYYLTSPFFVYGGLSLLISLFNKDAHLGQPWHERTQHGKAFLLTDGGHFDNIGIYALVRRGCRLLIVSDATAEAEMNDWYSLTNEERANRFQDFREVERKMSEDFGVEVTMQWDDFVGQPQGPARFDNTTPYQVFTGTIRSLPILTSGNPDDGDIKVIYIRAAYNLRWLRNSDGFIDEEKARSAEFPNDATLQQFFQERKVTAYRALARAKVLQHRAELKIAFEKVRTSYR